MANKKDAKEDAWAGLRFGKAMYELGMRLQDSYHCDRYELGKKMAKGKKLSKNEEQFVWGRSFWAQGILMMIEAEKQLEKADKDYKRTGSLDALLKRIGNVGVFSHY